MICLHYALLCLFVQVGGWCKATSTVNQYNLKTFTDTWTKLPKPKQDYLRQSQKKESIGNASVQELLPKLKTHIGENSKPKIGKKGQSKTEDHLKPYSISKYHIKISSLILDT